MAQNVKWVVPFVALDGTAYNINICKREYSGEANMLIAGTTPFVTNEDNNTDLLTPIRTQTGYINIVCDRSTWFQIINEGEYVYLSKDNSVEWQGFISKEAFNGDIFEPMIEYQIPVHCILSHLKSYKFVVSPLDTPTFATILNEALGMLPAGNPREIWWAESFSNNNVPEFLGCRFQRSNYYDNEEEKDGVILSESTYYNVLCEMCKYFGIVLRTYGENLLFCDTEGGAFAAAYTQDITLVEEEGASAVQVIATYDSAYISLEDLNYVSNNSQESIIQPVKDVTIKGTINKYDDFDGTYPRDTVDKWIDGHTTRIRWQDYYGARHYTREFTVDIHSGPHVGTTIQEWDQYENDIVIMKLYGYEDTGTGESLAHGARISSTDEVPLDDVQNKIDYNWSNMPYIQVQRLGTQYPVLGLYSKRSIYLSGGSGAINFFYKSHETIDVPNQHKMEWRLSIGDRYWNGTNWVKQPATFVVGWRQQDPTVECETNRTLGDGYDGYKGLIIPINVWLSGKVQLELIQAAPNVSSTNIHIDDIQLKYVNKKFIDEYKDDVIYNTSTSAECIDEYSQDCKFATSSDISGYGAVLNFTGAALDRYNYNGREVPPEENRMRTIAFRMSSPKSQIDVDVKDSDCIAHPWEVLGASDKYPSYSILSTSRNWRDSKINVKLIQL